MIATLTKTSEAGSLATEMSTAFGRMIECQIEHLKLSPSDVNAEQHLCDQHARNAPPSQLTWLDLASLTHHDPDYAAERWEEVKQAAHDELASGHRAAKAVEAGHIQAWQRAQFLALRDSLAEQWKPRNGIERTLIDTMAQAHTQYETWMARLALYSTLKSGEDRHDWKPPRVSDSAAMDQAAAMADRFNRLFVRSLRALRDLRRYVPQIVVQHAGQVNVGEQQINVGAS